MAKRKRRSPNKTNSPINKRSRHRSAHKGLSVEPLEDRRLLAADLGGGVTDVWQSYVPAEFLTDPSVVVAEPDTDGNIRVIIETMGKQENLAVLDAFSPAARNATPLSEFPIVIANVPVEDLDDISQLPNVRSVSVDYSIPATLADSVELINADVLHDNGNRGAGTTIAILDSGIDDTHDFFGTNGSRIVAERCFSTADAAGQQSLCPNGQATDVSASVDIAACLDGSDSLCEHGTHVAGIAAGSASTDSSAPGDGVAPGANIIAIQVFHRNNTNCGTKPTPCVRANSSDIIAGLDAVAALDAANPSLNIVAANMSLGSGGANRTHCDGTTPAMTTAINDLLFDRGIATVIAAGNSGFKRSVSFPGCISSAFTVGSTTNGDDISSFSNRAALLDVFAPGGGDGLLGTGGISSSVPGGEYGSKSGTSMAAPHVAGALAVLREANPARPTVDLMNDLVSNGVPITYTEFGTSVTTPRIDVLASVGGDNNDQISEATEIFLGSTNTSNALGESYDVDMFEFSVLGGVQRVVIEVTERNNSNVDPFLRLFDENGTELANDSNNGSSAEIDFVLPGSGTYFVGVSAENNEAYNPFTGFGDSEGDAGGSFTLTISDNNDQISEAIPLSLNEPQNGNINLNTDIDLFEFNATAGQTVSFDIDRRDSSDLDSFLRLFSPDGNTVLALDDDDNNPDGPLPEVSNLESFIRFTFPTTDTYYLGVSSFGNSSYNLFDDSGDTAGSTTGPYSLTAFIDNLDANDQISEAINIPVGTSNGIFQLFSSLDVTMFSTDVTAGQTVGFDVDNTADSSLDAELRLWDEEGNLLAIDDDTNGPVPEFNNFEPYIEHTFNDAGRYYFSVAVFNNDEFDPISGLFDNGTAPGGSYGVSVTDETITEPANRRLVTIADDIVGLDGETSLREAIDFANSNPGDDTITFAPALHGSTVELTQGELDVTRPTILVGPGANLLTISANYNSRIFDAFSSLTIQDMTLADGHATQNGGAILGQNVTVTRSRLLNNTAGNQGGAIHITGFGNLTVSDSEFSGNSADEGGAISLNGGSGFLAQGTVTNSTISGNTANDGGAIYSRGTNLTVRSSTVAFNSSGITSVANPYSTNALVSASIVAENGREDFDGEVILSESLLGSDHNTTINFSQSVDFIQDREPMLEPLAFNGASATRTHKLLPNSPAINAATASGQTPGFDQAGNDRVRLSHLDMGV